MSSEPDKAYSKQAQRLIETALVLFYQNGFHATGIDKVLAEAGVSKMTLYNHFGSKEELIIAVLRLRDIKFRDWFSEIVEKKSGGSQDRLLATFDALHEWINSPSFYGCMFINASAEFSKPDDPIHLAAAEHKELLLAYIVSLAKDAGAPDPERLGSQIFLLNEGAIVTAHVSGNKDAALEAKAAARTILKTELSA